MFHKTFTLKKHDVAKVAPSQHFDEEEIINKHVSVPARTHIVTNVMHTYAYYTLHHTTSSINHLKTQHHVSSVPVLFLSKGAFLGISREIAKWHGAGRMHRHVLGI